MPDLVVEYQGDPLALRFLRIKETGRKPLQVSLVAPDRRQQPSVLDRRRDLIGEEGRGCQVILPKILCPEAE